MARKPAKSIVRQWTGNVITEPGIYRGISLEIYHSAELFGSVPAISSSGLRTIYNFSPAHYWATSPYNPKRVEPKDTEAFIFGRAVHHLLLGEPHFNRFFIVRPEEVVSNKTGEIVSWHGNRPECKKFMATQARLGKTVLTTQQGENIIGMAEAISLHPLVKKGALRGETENSYFWRDPETGIFLKWRPDNTPLSSNDYVDIKTTTDVRWFALQRTIDEFGYHQQGALGRVGCRMLRGHEMESFSLFFVEKENPWAHCFVQLKDADLELGERQNRAALRLFWRCWKSKEWPGPAKEDHAYIEIGERSRTRIEAQLKEDGL